MPRLVSTDFEDEETAVPVPAHIQSNVMPRLEPTDDEQFDSTVHVKSPIKTNGMPSLEQTDDEQSDDTLYVKSPIKTNGMPRLEPTDDEAAEVIVKSPIQANGMPRLEATDCDDDEGNAPVAIKSPIQSILSRSRLFSKNYHSCTDQSDSDTSKPQSNVGLKKPPSPDVRKNILQQQLEKLDNVGFVSRQE